jgi:hypothetical protein
VESLTEFLEQGFRDGVISGLGPGDSVIRVAAQGRITSLAYEGWERPQFEVTTIVLQDLHGAIIRHATVPSPLGLSAVFSAGQGVGKELRAAADAQKADPKGFQYLVPQDLDVEMRAAEKRRAEYAGARAVADSKER